MLVSLPHRGSNDDDDDDSWLRGCSMVGSTAVESMNDDALLVGWTLSACLSGIAAFART